MTIARTLLAAGLALAAGSALAGSFVELPTSAPLRKAGSPVNAADQFFLSPGPITGTDSNGFTTFALPSYLTFVAGIETEVELAEAAGEEPEEVGTFFDYIFRDTTDNKLVFGSRLVFTDDDAEANDIFRAGFTGYSAAVAWTPATSGDRFITSAARTATGLKQGVDVFDPDVVDFRTDINVSEGAAYSGWYLIKSDAPNYALVDDVVRIRQGGEEGQLPTQDILAGFAPAPVPEPSTYALLLAGLGVIGLIARRRIA